MTDMPSQSPRPHGRRGMAFTSQGGKKPHTHTKTRKGGTPRWLNIVGQIPGGPVYLRYLLPPWASSCPPPAEAPAGGLLLGRHSSFGTQPLYTRSFKKSLFLELTRKGSDAVSSYCQRQQLSKHPDRVPTKTQKSLDLLQKSPAKAPENGRQREIHP